VLIDRGYDGLRYRDVAEAAGVPVASLQHYFPNLADLRREALLHQVHTEIEELSDNVHRLNDPWDRLTSIVVSAIALDPVDRKPEWMLWLEYWRAAGRDPDLAVDNLRTQLTINELIDLILSEGVESGVFKPRAEVSAITKTIVAMINGYGIHLAINDKVGDAEEAISLVEAYVRLMLQVDPALPSFEFAYSRLA